MTGSGGEKSREIRVEPLVIGWLAPTRVAASRSRRIASIEPVSNKPSASASLARASEIVIRIVVMGSSSGGEPNGIFNSRRETGWTPPSAQRPRKRGSGAAVRWAPGQKAVFGGPKAGLGPGSRGGSPGLHLVGRGFLGSIGGFENRAGFPRRPRAALRGGMPTGGKSQKRPRPVEGSIGWGSVGSGFF